MRAADLVLRLGVAGCLAWSIVGCRTERADDRVVTVERGSLAITVEVVGSIRAVESSIVGPPGVPGVWDYKIAMMAPEGAAVPEGEPIVAFDPSDLQRRLEAKMSERDSSAKQLELKLVASRMAREDEKLARADADAALRKARQKADAPAGVTASIDLEKARLERTLAEKKRAYLERKAAAARRIDEAEVSRWRSKQHRAQARVAEIATAIEQMTVKAPRQGTVIYETNWRGEKKKVGDSAWRAETIMQVASLAEMEARGEVDEVDANKVVVGQTVLVRLDALADVELSGKIREISHTVRRTSPDNPLKTLRIDIALDPVEGVSLRPGMRFRGLVEIDRANDVLLVPIEAVDTTSDGPVLWRQSGTSREAVQVILGRRDATRVEVEGGVNEGDEFALPLGADRRGAS